MNKIKMELFENFGVISEESYSLGDEIELEISDKRNGYLSIGHRIIPLTDGNAQFSMQGFSDGILNCYLMLDGERYTLPSIEKSGDEIRTHEQNERVKIAEIRSIKALNDRLSAMESDIESLKTKVNGRISIL